MISVMDVAGRIAKKCDLARTDAVTTYSLLKTLKYVHQELHIIAPALVRDWKTSLSDPINIVGTSPTADSMAGVTGEVPISSILVKGVAKSIIEIHSVANANLTAPYKRVNGLEHIANQNISDESGATGRFWWPVRGNDSIQVFRGSNIADSAVVIGFTSDFDTSYANLAQVDNIESIEFDCPPVLVSYIVMQTSMRIIEDYRMQMPEHLGQDLSEQRQIVQAADANMAQQLMAMERRGADSIR